MKTYLSSQRDYQRVEPSGNILPVEANGKNAQSFVAVGTPKYPREICGSWICETEDGEAREKREYPFGQGFPDKDPESRLVTVPLTCGSNLTQGRQCRRTSASFDCWRHVLYPLLY